MRTCYAVDFETYYDKEYSLRKMNTWKYVFDDRFNAYLVAVHGADISVSVDPSQFDWESIRGSRLLMHNVSFDRVILMRFVKEGKISQDLYDSWSFFDTADMSAYLKVKRDLKSAARILCGLKMSKAVRTDMEGVTPHDARAKGWWDKIVEYGGNDAKATYALWEQHHDKWPENEQRLSELNFLAGVRGMAVDVEACTEAAKLLERASFEALQLIPWKDDAAPLSAPQMRKKCAEVGLTDVPMEFSAKSPIYLAWEDKYSEEFPWIRAVRDYRRLNSLASKVQTLRLNAREDRSFMIQVKYCGAHTGRFSAGGDSGGKFNVQNLPRAAMFGVDVRNMLVARPGHTLLICDYAQIEARVLLWRVKDQPALDAIRREGNLYQAYARSKGYFSGGSLKKENFQLYQWAKACVLQLGYGCGWNKFLTVANSDMYKLDLTEETAKEAVYSFRDQNPLITKHWEKHDKALRQTLLLKDDTHGIKLASGRILWYFNPRRELGKWPDGTPKWDHLLHPVRGGDKIIYAYGAALTENEIQATSRDILRDAWIEIMSPRWTEKFNWHVVLNVHDELVIEVPDAHLEEAKVLIPELMTISTKTWAQGCPVEIEMKATQRYEK